MNTSPTIEEYKKFISECKTERECISYVASRLSQEGFGSGPKKFFFVKMGKALAAFNIRDVDHLSHGLNILCAHIDSPRLDVKSNPVFADGQLVFLNTHYYGGIRKYQWVTTPLALHGVVCKKDGTTVDICIGEKEDDPVFCISDLLPHLAQDQSQKKANEFITGEELDVIIGSGAEKDEELKASILDLLKVNYGIEESDFLSAELEIVPAGPAKDLGFDRNLILGYGQDDRSCAFASLQAFIDDAKDDTSTKNTCLLLVDKEEIGSVGATGFDSNLFENMVLDLVYSIDYSKPTYTSKEGLARLILERSNLLSSDVNAAFDPHHADVFDKDNTCFLGKGSCFCKFTGARGKSGSNDANPEYIAKLRSILDAKDIKYQFAELGKVDKGGGGTIAYLAARYGMNVIDMGIPILSMHAPWEVSSKADIENAVSIYKEFLSKMDALAMENIYSKWRK